MKHFLQETDFHAAELPALFQQARDLKRTRGQPGPQPLAGQTWALLFSKSSTRTRVSFEVAIRELGGSALFLSKNDIQLGRGESIQDTARVLSRYLHGLVVRTHAHDDVVQLARHGSLPVVNALTDFNHPCQIFADALTLGEVWAGRDGDLLGALRGRRITFVGDCSCNVANSWILGAAVFGMRLTLAGPAEFAPGPDVEAALAAAGLKPRHRFTTDLLDGVRDADCVYTDVWVSMGREDEEAERLRILRPYAVTAPVFAAAHADAVFLHCLPAYPGKEVDQAVLDNPRARVFDQAENRLHMQKAILAALAASRARS